MINNISIFGFTVESERRRYIGIQNDVWTFVAKMCVCFLNNFILSNYLFTYHLVMPSFAGTGVGEEMALSFEFSDAYQVTNLLPVPQKRKRSVHQILTSSLKLSLKQFYNIMNFGCLEYSNNLEKS